MFIDFTNLTNFEILLIIISAVSVVFGVTGWIVPALKKKGVDVKGGIEATGTVLDTADTVLDTVRGFFPGVPSLETMDKIIDWAKKGTEAAEQLYKTSQIEGSQRKEQATQYVYQYIAAAGIELTDDMKKIVEGAIEAAVYTLPKTHEEYDA